MNDLKVDELLTKVDSRYGLVVATAKRARQINEYTSTLGLNDALGIPGPQVHTRSQHPLSIAIEELREDKLEVGFRQPPEEADEEAGVGAAGADDFLSPPSATSAPVEATGDTADIAADAADSAEDIALDDTVDSGAPSDEGAA